MYLKNDKRNVECRCRSNIDNQGLVSTQNSSYTSHSAYDATSTESDGVKIDDKG